MEITCKKNNNLKNEIITCKWHGGHIRVPKADVNTDVVQVRERVKNVKQQLDTIFVTTFCGHNRPIFVSRVEDLAYHLQAYYYVDMSYPYIHVNYKISLIYMFNWLSFRLRTWWPSWLIFLPDIYLIMFWEFMF